MKKELLAGFTLLSLILGAAYNLIYLKQLVQNMNTHLSTAEQAYSINNFSVAESELSTALEIWLNADEYTHIFIRHSEIDAATDAYYEALSSVREKDVSAPSFIQKVKYHINSIYSMELLTLKSIF